MFLYSAHNLYTNVLECFLLYNYHTIKIYLTCCLALHGGCVSCKKKKRFMLWKIKKSSTLPFMRSTSLSILQRIFFPWHWSIAILSVQIITVVLFSLFLSRVKKICENIHVWQWTKTELSKKETCDHESCERKKKNAKTVRCISLYLARTIARYCIP